MTPALDRKPTAWFVLSIQCQNVWMGQAIPFLNQAYERSCVECLNKTPATSQTWQLDACLWCKLLTKLASPRSRPGHWYDVLERTFPTCWWHHPLLWVSLTPVLGAFLSPVPSPTRPSHGFCSGPVSEKERINS